MMRIRGQFHFVAKEPLCKCRCLLPIRAARFHVGNLCSSNESFEEKGHHQHSEAGNDEFLEFTRDFIASEQNWIG